MRYQMGVSIFYFFRCKDKNFTFFFPYGDSRI
uniref:Uncharacterized protein n=1 Tax=Microviridae sp. ctCVC7 TaxID=2826729 RepID=A0A8S5M2L3_9VIRU|nr:MAG TPA: hypothetical protein [Microviridae sp. ctCVC7]